MLGQYRTTAEGLMVMPRLNKVDQEGIPKQGASTREEKGDRFVESKADSTKQAWGFKNDQHPTLDPPNQADRRPHTFIYEIEEPRV